MKDSDIGIKYKNISLIIINDMLENNKKNYSYLSDFIIFIDFLKDPINYGYNYEVDGYDIVLTKFDSVVLNNEHLIDIPKWSVYRKIHKCLINYSTTPTPDGG